MALKKLFALNKFFALNMLIALNKLNSVLLPGQFQPRESDRLRHGSLAESGRRPIGTPGLMMIMIVLYK